MGLNSNEFAVLVGEFFFFDKCTCRRVCGLEYCQIA